jgi:hypothetical protein
MGDNDVVVEAWITVLFDKFVRFIPSLVTAALAMASCSSSQGGSPEAGTDSGSPDTSASDSGSPDGTSDSGVPADGASHDAGLQDAATNDAGHASDSGPLADASLSPPAPAAGAGFDTLVFEDDFTTNDTIAPTQNAASGYKWYWSFDDSTVHPWSVSTTATAASIANGNTGGGNNASPHGGILTVNGPGAPNDALVTVPGWALNNASAVLPAEGDGCWSHAYFEAYIQFQIDGTDSSVESTGWPAFWSWSMQGLKNFGFGGSSLTTANYSEIDFMETYGIIFGQTPGNWTATMHQWPANNASDGHNNHTDDNWHTYGCLWTSTGAGAGQVKFYFDGAQVDATVDTGTGQTQFSLEAMYQFLVLGSGKGWDMNVDWVRVWQ